MLNTSNLSLLESRGISWSDWAAPVCTATHQFVPPQPCW